MKTHRTYIFMYIYKNQSHSTKLVIIQLRIYRLVQMEFTVSFSMHYQGRMLNTYVVAKNMYLKFFEDEAFLFGSKTRLAVLGIRFFIIVPVYARLYFIKIQGKYVTTINIHIYVYIQIQIQIYRYIYIYIRMFLFAQESYREFSVIEQKRSLVTIIKLYTSIMIQTLQIRLLKHMNFYGYIFADDNVLTKSDVIFFYFVFPSDGEVKNYM